MFLMSHRFLANSSSKSELDPLKQKLQCATENLIFVLMRRLKSTTLSTPPLKASKIFESLLIFNSLILCLNSSINVLEF